MFSIFDWVVLSLFTTLILLALGGNVLVCVAVFYDRKLRKQPENLFLVSLAVSDLFVSIYVMVFAAANDLLGHWPFGSVYCQFWICLDITCSTASILNLCAIAFDRYLHISRPMLYARHSSRGVIIVSIVLVWLLSGLIGSAQILFGVASGNEGVEYPTTKASQQLMIKLRQTEEASMDVCQLTLQPIYAIFSSVLSFFLPATIMLLMYSKLYMYARMHVRSIRAQLKQATSLLIMQLASDNIRQVVVRPCFLVGLRCGRAFQNSQTDIHFPDREHAYCNGSAPTESPSCGGQIDIDPIGNCETVERSHAVNCGGLQTIATAKDHRDTVSVTAIPSAQNLKASLRAGTPHSASYSHLDRTGTMQLDVSSADSRRLSSARHDVSPAMPRHASRPSVSDQKARFTLGVIMGTFLLCWLPFFVVNIWRSLQPHLFSQWVFQVVTWLGYANSTANPIIYVSLNRDFRRAFKCIVLRVFYCCDDSAYKRRFHTPFLTESKL